MQRECNDLDEVEAKYLRLLKEMNPQAYKDKRAEEKKRVMREQYEQEKRERMNAAPVNASVGSSDHDGNAALDESESDSSRSALVGRGIEKGAARGPAGMISVSPTELVAQSSVLDIRETSASSGALPTLLKLNKNRPHPPNGEATVREVVNQVDRRAAPEADDSKSFSAIRESSPPDVPFSRLAVSTFSSTAMSVDSLSGAAVAGPSATADLGAAATWSSAWSRESGERAAVETDGGAWRSAGRAPTPTPITPLSVSVASAPLAAVEPVQPEHSKRDDSKDAKGRDAEPASREVTSTSPFEPSVVHPLVSRSQPAVAAEKPPTSEEKKMASDPPAKVAGESTKSLSFAVPERVASPSVAVAPAQQKESKSSEGKATSIAELKLTASAAHSGLSIPAQASGWKKADRGGSKRDLKLLDISMDDHDDVFGPPRKSEPKEDPLLSPMDKTASAATEKDQSSPVELDPESDIRRASIEQPGDTVSSLDEDRVLMGTVTLKQSFDASGLTLSMEESQEAAENSLNDSRNSSSSNVNLSNSDGRAVLDASSQDDLPLQFVPSVPTHEPPAPPMKYSVENYSEHSPALSIKDRYSPDRDHLGKSLELSAASVNMDNDSVFDDSGVIADAMATEIAASYLKNASLATLETVPEEESGPPIQEQKPASAVVWTLGRAPAELIETAQAVEVFVSSLSVDNQHLSKAGINKVRAYITFTFKPYQPTKIMR
jgi:hypothetical protein